jgi:cell division inhibitor SepF
MAASIFDRIVNFVGLSPEEEETETTAEAPSPERRRGNFSVHTNTASSKVVVFNPTAFDEVQKFAEALKNRDAVIVNFENTDDILSRRIIDFLSGVTYVIGGDTQKVGQSVMIFAPPNFDISKDLAYATPNLYSRKRSLDFLDSTN